MQRSFPALTGLACLLFGITLGCITLGCNSSTADPASNSTPADASQAETPAATDHDHADGDHADHDHSMTAGGETSMAEMMKGLKELSPEDYQSAMKQHVCPVSGEMLGSMGAPKKVDVGGRSVWICCDGCRDKLLTNPEEYLSKLDRS